MIREGYYHVYVELGSGGTHRYAIVAESADDAQEHIENYCIPKDYPREAYQVTGVRHARAI